MSTDSNLFFNKSTFFKITKEGQLENDKQRILKKFNFNFAPTKVSLEESNSNLNSEQNYYYKNSFNENNNKNDNKNKGTYTEEPTLRKKQIIQYFPIYNNNNNKNNKINKNNNNINNKKNVKHKFSTNKNSRNKLSLYEKNPKNEIINSFDVTKLKKYEREDSKNESFSSKTKKDDSKNEIKMNNFSSGDLKVENNSESIINHNNDSLFNISKENIDENILNNNQVVNGIYQPSPPMNEMNNFQNTDLVNIMNNNPKNEKNSKILNLFTHHSSCNITSRIVNEETDGFHLMNDNQKYKFISSIREDNNKIIQFNIKSFLKLSDYSLFILLSFCFEYYNILINNTNHFISTKINLSLNNIFKETISKFIENYGTFLSVKNFYFIQKNFNNNKKYYPLFNLVILCSVITDKKNISYEIGYKFITKGKQYENIWKFDIKKKKNIIIWLSSELEKYNHRQRRFCYTSPISTFSKGDIIQLEINIFNKKSSINPFSIEWIKPVISISPDEIYQKTPIGNVIPYDPLRACEIENMIHLWRTDGISEKKKLLDEFKKIFSKHFKIKSMVYDQSKIYFFKIKMVANSLGKIPKNTFTNFDIDIIPYESVLQNEIQTIGCLNSNIYTNNINIRLGTNVIFYLTEM